MAIKAYPLSTPDGKIIPIDIISPISTGDFAVSATPMGAVVNLGDMSAAILEVWSDVDCKLGFTTSPATTSTATYALRAHDPRLVHIGDNANISAVSTLAGNVYYNKIDVWDALGTQYQLDTRE